MPSYTIEIPGKGSYTVDSPTDLTDYQAYRAVQKQIAADDLALQQHQTKTGFIPAVKAGARQFVAGCKRKRYLSYSWCLPLSKSYRAFRWYCRSIRSSYCSRYSCA